jgi:hypothetical protein
MHSILVVLLLFTPLAVIAGQCPVTEKSLQGAWERKSESGFFEEMTFKIEGTHHVFNSWLHQRLEFSGGSWKLENCTLHIAHPTEKDLTVDFVVVKASQNRIFVHEVGDKEVSTYQLIK